MRPLSVHDRVVDTSGKKILLLCGGDSVGVSVGVEVEVGETVAVGVELGVAVIVGLAVTVGVRLGVAVAVGLAVIVGVPLGVVVVVSDSRRAITIVPDSPRGSSLNCSELTTYPRTVSVENRKITGITRIRRKSMQKLVVLL